MSSDESSPPPAKRPKLKPSRNINGLSDADLAAIFKHLPPRDRLLASAVCKRWLGVSRLAWLDVKHLDLSVVPNENIAVIVKQCPNLQTIFVSRKTFHLNALHRLSQLALVSLTLYDCDYRTTDGFSSCDYKGWVEDAFAAVFSAEFQNSSLQELTVRGMDLIIPISDEENINSMSISFRASFPASLKRLQLRDLKSSCEVVRFFPRPTFCSSLAGLERLQDLECLILNDTHTRIGWGAIGDELNVSHPFADSLYAKLGALRNLRELHLGSGLVFRPCLRTIFGLPKLEVLFLHNIRLRDETCVDWFVKLFTGHPSLRILVVSGQLSLLVENEEIDVKLPSRQRYPNGFGAAPLPFLHIFLENEVFQSEKITFPRPFDCAQIHQIYWYDPLPQFLDDEDIKPIFEGVWIVQKIKEAAEFGDRLYKRSYPSL